MTAGDAGRHEREPDLSDVLGPGYHHAWDDLDGPVSDHYATSGPHPSEAADYYDDEPRYTCGTLPLHYRVRRFTRDWFAVHGVCARTFARRRLYVHRKYRAARFEFEWHNYDAIRFVTVGVASPQHHRWWATMVTFYVSRGRGKQRVTSALFGRFPSRRWSRG